MFHSITRKTLATITTGALATAALALVASPALADDPLRLGELQVTPLSGQIDLSDSSGWLESAYTNTGEVCPTGHRGRSGFYAVIDGVLDDSAAIAGTIRPNIDYGDGIMGGINDGEDHVYRTGERVVTDSSVFPWEIVPTGAEVELRHYCQADALLDPSVDPYYSVFIDVEVGGAWAVVSQSGPSAYDDWEGDIEVVVPTPQAVAPTGLKISVKPNSPVTLTNSATRNVGETWSATGSLSNVTVNDDRQEATAAAWTLNGKASNFTASGVTDPISSTNLGWLPAKVSGAGAAGAAVAPGSNGGLSTDKALATGVASDSANVTTTVNAALTLEVPAAAEAGAYKSTLTLTLI